MPPKNSTPKSPSRRSKKRTASSANANENEIETTSHLTEVTQVEPQTKRRRQSRRLSVASSAHSDKPSAEPSQSRNSRHSRLSEPALSIETHSASSIQNDRRATLSPSRLSSILHNGDDVQVQFSPLSAVWGPDARTRRRLARNHMSEEMNSIDDHRREDLKLRRELEDLRKKHTAMDEEYKQHMWDWETQRQAAIDLDQDQEHPEELKVMADEVERLKKQVEELQTANPHIDFDADATSMLDQENADADMDETYEGQEDVAMDEEPMGAAVDDLDEDNMRTLVGSDPPQIDLPKQKESHLTKSSKVTTKTSVHTHINVSERKRLLDPMREVEIKEFESRIAVLHAEVAEKDAVIDNLLIELKALGFSHGDSPEVLVAIRSAFRDARLAFGDIFPDDTAIELANGDFLQAIIDRLEVSKHELKVESQQTHDVLIENDSLQQTISTLEAKATELEARKKALEKQWHDMDIDREDKSKTIIDLEAIQEGLEQDLNESNAAVVEHEALIGQLEAEIRDFEFSIARHKEAERLLSEEKDTVIGKFEELQNLFENLKQERDATVQDLTSKYETEVSYRAAAEEDADSKQTQVTRLERSLEEAMEEAERLRDEVAAVGKQSRETQEELTERDEELAERRTTNEALEKQISELNVQIQRLENDLELTRESLASEHKQREAAEEDIDDRDNRIQNFEEKITQLGKDANELRNKLWEKQNKIEELDKEAIEREDQFQEDMAAEIERRERAESESNSRQQQIDELQVEIENIAVAKTNLEQEKDAIILTCNDRIDELEAGIEESQSQLANLAEDSASRIANLESTIAELENTILAHEASIDRLQVSSSAAERAHRLEIEGKDRQVEKVSSDLRSANEDIAQLQEEKEDLSKRLEEAEDQISDLHDEHTNEVRQLQNDIGNLDGTVEQLRTTSETKQHEYEEVIEEERHNYGTLRTYATQLESDKAELHNQVQVSKEMFYELKSESQATINDLEREVRNAVSRFENRKEGFLEWSSAQASSLRKALEPSEETTHLATPISTQDVSLKRASDEEPDTVVKKAKKSQHTRIIKTRGYRDSGIGAEDDEDEMEASI